jgi:tRNA-dihydrouridine synthase B
MRMTEDAAKPFKIGDHTLNSRVVLAPMAGVTDKVFRALVKRWAPDSLVCTEMISSNGFVQMQKARKPQDQYICSRSEADYPIAYQLAAHQEAILLEAAESLLEQYQPVSIDLNMGCPVKKITGNFEGCALMKAPAEAAKLIQHLTRRLPVPVTVKFRLGWDLNTMNYLDFGKMCEDSGASMVTLHARTRSQGYQPGCKWDAFGELKQALHIPVVANGDIRTAEDARFLMDTYGVDGVMIGRAALGEPWLLGEIDALLKTGVARPPMTLQERFAVAYAHAETYVTTRGHDKAIFDMRKHLAWYAKDFYGASLCRRELTAVNSLDDIRVIFDRALNQQQDAA